MNLPALTRRFFTRSVHCIDSDYFPAGVEATRALPESMDWGRAIPFIFLHLGCLGVIWVGWSPVALTVCALLYVIRMFFVTGIYHRYFCHKAYKASRPVQFLFALIGLLCVQRGALWWAAVHRHHHAHSDVDNQHVFLQLQQPYNQNSRRHEVEKVNALVHHIQHSFVLVHPFYPLQGSKLQIP